MNFQFNEEQIALRDGLRDFGAKRANRERLKEIEESGGFDRDLWRDIHELGVFAMARPANRGGLGRGCVESTLCLEELGRRVVPGPLVWSCLATALLDGVSDGTKVVGGLDLVSRVNTPCMVEHFQYIDSLLILRPAGVYTVDPQTLASEPVEKLLDPFTPVHYVESLPQGEQVAGEDTARVLWLWGACLAAGQLLGFAEETVDIACEYAKQREQFDRPIGQFQSIKHLLADMFVRQEAARSATYAAAATIDNPGAGDPRRAVGSAKIIASEAALKNAKSCIQILGGMGYTWDIPAHYYLKRYWVLNDLFGSVDEHAMQIADGIADEVAL